MPGWPIMMDVQAGSNSVTVTWDGPAGFYQLFQTPDVAGGSWQPVEGPSLTRTATITEIHSNAFFQVLGPSPQYAGALSCQACHPAIYDEEQWTAHTRAFERLRPTPPANEDHTSDPVCLRCHTVGRNPDPTKGPLPTGFVDEATTSNLAGVQCENCHGPAAPHAANENNPTVRPRVELAATVCGGCHNAESHRPHYEEWDSSGHGAVDEAVKGRFEDPEDGESYIPSCGGCHSGTVRHAFLNDDPLPDAQEAGAIGIACITCHDPHRVYVRTNLVSGMVSTNQLRNPTYSTNDFWLSTSDVFTNKYDPEINLCAQCHNHRGAVWTSTSRPPHHSPQYNIMLGTVGELTEGQPARLGGHAEQVEDQCATCHVQTEDYVPGEQLAVTGHKFQVESFEACRECHSFPKELTEFTTGIVSNRIDEVKALLDEWGANKAPEPLRSTYGTNAWEYTNSGDLSDEPGPEAGADGQDLIPENIMKARFNLYLVLYDGSYGVHNAPHSVTLLLNAKEWVQQELDKTNDVSTSMANMTDN